MDLFCHSILSANFAGKRSLLQVASKKGGWGILAQCWGSFIMHSLINFSHSLWCGYLAAN